MCVRKRNPDNTILERRFEIKCNLAKYDEKNVSLRKRHPAIFRNQEYIFVPSNDMVLSMPFAWVDSLGDSEWTTLNKTWKKKTKRMEYHPGNTNLGTFGCLRQT